jgi:hypothetical protein
MIKIDSALFKEAEHGECSGNVSLDDADAAFSALRGCALETDEQVQLLLELVVASVQLSQCRLLRLPLVLLALYTLTQHAYSRRSPMIGFLFKYFPCLQYSALALTSLHYRLFASQLCSAL